MADATSPADPWWREYKQLITWSVTVTLTTVLAAMTALVGRYTAPIPPPPPPVVERVEVPVWMSSEHPESGWVSDPDAVAAVVAQLDVKVFADTPAGEIPVRDLPKFVYGWKPYAQLFGRPPPVKNQGDLGSCVSFGTNTAAERTLSGEIVRRNGAKDEFSLFAEEATYGGSRVEVGGGRIRGDGSVGAWAAEFVTKWGMVPRQKYPEADLTEYSTARGRDWGRGGVPAWAEAVARKFPIKSTTQVKDWVEAKKALAQSYNVAVCSNQGFARQRDSRGVARASGSWAHCMCLDGYHVDENGSEYGHSTNSWGGSYHTGPVGWGEPNGDGFWADSSVIDRMLRQGDSWAFSGVTGFPRRAPLDWAARKVHDRDLIALSSLRRPLGGLNVLAW
jgi:hypothetical protein